jgi:hypothetical protein
VTGNFKKGVFMTIEKEVETDIYPLTVEEYETWIVVEDDVEVE